MGDSNGVLVWCGSAALGPDGPYGEPAVRLYDDRNPAWSCSPPLVLQDGSPPRMMLGPAYTTFHPCRQLAVVGSDEAEVRAKLGELWSELTAGEFVWSETDPLTFHLPDTPPCRTCEARPVETYPPYYRQLLAAGEPLPQMRFFVLDRETYEAGKS